ncbi:MAG: helix-turn-helix domain-containing protein [Hyphomicrobium sp.]|nr:helix-turn-helix domain-containing protein [Hyphomicrobium sp.]
MRSAVLTIGNLSKATGTKVETIRYYERIGLLAAPARTAGNYRAYGKTELGRLSFIRRARELGFGIDQIRALLSLSEKKRRSCKAIDEIAREHLEHVDRKISDLVMLREVLHTTIQECSRGTVATCRIIEALSPVGQNR